MPSILKNYMTGIRKIASMPQENLAVPSTKGFINHLGRQAGAETAQGINQTTDRKQSENALENEKRDISMARKDANIALPLSIANTGIQGVTAYDRMIMAKAQEQQDKINQEKYDTMIELIEKNTKRYQAALNGEVIP